MNRSARRHRSTKVPNVKLRPPPPVHGNSDASRTQSGRGDNEAADEAAREHYRTLRDEYERKRRRREEKQRSTDERERSSDDDDDDDERDNGEDVLPLAGMVLCMSGLGDEKGLYNDIAQSLGATVEANLTDSATHLIAHSFGSIKYTSALRVGIPIMHPLWLQEMRQRWRDAQGIDVDDLSRRHLLKPLQGVVLGLAGITDSEKRHQIRDRVQAANGTTPIPFRLDGSFTHLVCEDTTSSETLKVVYTYRKRAQRFLRRGELIPDNEHNATEMKAVNSIKLVRTEWLEDSLAVGGCLPEKHYLISENRPTAEERQKQVEMIHENRRERRKMLEGLRKNVQQRNDAPSGKRKANGNAREEDLERPRSVRRPRGQIAQLVEKLSHRPREESSPLPNTPKTIATEQTDMGAKTFAKGSRQEMQVSKVPAKKYGAIEDEPTNSLGNESDRDGASSEKSLAEVSFRIDLGDTEKNSRILKALQHRGILKVVAPEDEMLADFHVLPLIVPKLPSGTNLGIPVTHFFVERCLSEGRLLRLDESFALQPSTRSFPVPGTDATLIGITGLGPEGAPDRHQAEKALEAAGIPYDSLLKRGRHTHLLVGREAEGNTNSRSKIEKAMKWGIAVVDLAFISKLFQFGKISPPPNLARPPSHATVARLNPAIGESSVESTDVDSHDLSATMDETQDFHQDSHAISDKENEKGRKSAEDNIAHRTAQQRPWLRAASGSHALLDGESSRGISNRTRRPGESMRLVAGSPEVSQSSLSKDYESQGAGTLALGASTADEVMALLEERVPPDDARVLQTRNGNADPFSGSARKYRRLPPSMRQGRRSTVTPGRDETEGRTDADILQYEGKDADVDLAEMLLAKGREEEAMMRLAGLNATQMQSSLASVAGKEESLRVVYDDPAARRERRKMADLIGLARSKREEQNRLQAMADAGQVHDIPTEENAEQGNEALEAKTIGTNSAEEDHSPTKLTRDGYARRDFSPSIKARKQPGTAVRM